MTGLWSVTQCAFASCAPMSTEQGTELSKKMELPQTPRTMESDHANLDSPLCEEGIEMEFDKPPYYSNARSEDAYFQGMIDATKDDNDDTTLNLPTRVEDSTLTHGKGVDDATTDEAALQSNPTALKKKISHLLKRRWSKRSDPQTQDSGEVPEATAVSSSEDSSTDSTKEKKGSDSIFDSQEENCIGKAAEGSGMFSGDGKHIACLDQNEDIATKPYPDHIVLKQNQQKSRTHVRDDVSTLSSSTGGNGASKNAKSFKVDILGKRKCGSFAQVDKLSTVPEKDDRDDTSLAKNNDALPLMIDKLIDNGDIYKPQVTKHSGASIQNTIVVNGVPNVQKDATVSLQNDPCSTCGPSSTVKAIGAIPQGATLSKIPICQYDVSLMKPLFEPEDDDSDDEDDINQDVGILKMVAKKTLAKDCFQMDMNEPDLWRYNFNQCNQGPKIQDATSRLNQDHHVTNHPAPSSSPSTDMDTVEISVAETDEKRDARKSSEKGFFGRFRTRRPHRSAPSRETVQYNVSSGDNNK